MSRNKSRFWLLFLGLFILPLHLILAQPVVFNNFYTLDASAAEIQAIAPQGNNNGFMAVSNVVDSSTGSQAMRVSRFSKDGIEEKGTFFNLPDYPSRKLYVNRKAITRIHDNRYAIAGAIQEPGLYTYSFIAIADSNGIVIRYKDLVFTDSSNMITDLHYDDLGHIIAGGYEVNKTRDSAHGILYKLDTALNTIWVRSYHPTVVLRSLLVFSLLTDHTGYTLCGGAVNTGRYDLPLYKSQAVMIHTDTAGVEQWVYTSPTSSYRNFYNHITHALHTSDGGYLFAVCAAVQNKWPTSEYFELIGKKSIVKLDAGRNKLWEIPVDSYFTSFGITPMKFAEMTDSSFVLYAPISSDSLAPNYIYSHLMLVHYDKNGRQLYSHTLKEPKTSGDTSKDSGGGFWDIMHTADKGFLMAGSYYNYTDGAPLPRQRGWMMKLDSNGCLGPGDSQCWPASIPEIDPVFKSINIYPNPSDGNLTVNAQNITESNFEARIYNLLGQMVWHQDLRLSGNKTDIKVNLAGGNYIIELRDTKGQIYRHKIHIR